MPRQRSAKEGFCWGGRDLGRSDTQAKVVERLTTDNRSGGSRFEAQELHQHLLRFRLDLNLERNGRCGLRRLPLPDLLEPTDMAHSIMDTAYWAKKNEEIIRQARRKRRAC